MIYAILNAEMNKVENLAESYLALEDNWIGVPFGCPVDIGDTYEDGCFYDENGTIRVIPVIQETINKVADLEEDNNLKDAQIKALSDRNDFLEDCIAEMATIVYA